MSGEPLRFQRRGPFIELLTGTWVDARTVLNVYPGDVTSTLQLGRGTTMDVDLPILTIVEGVAAALLDWEEERAEARERGRLMALDAGSIPEGEEESPPGGTITGIGYEDNPFA